MSEPKRQTKPLGEASWDLVRAVVGVIAAEQGFSPKLWTLIIDDGTSTRSFTNGTLREQFELTRLVVREIERQIAIGG